MPCNPLSVALQVCGSRSRLFCCVCQELVSAGSETWEGAFAGQSFCVCKNVGMCVCVLAVEIPACLKCIRADRSVPPCAVSTWAIVVALWHRLFFGCASLLVQVLMCQACSDGLDTWEIASLQVHTSYKHSEACVVFGMKYIAVRCMHFCAVTAWKPLAPCGGMPALTTPKLI